MTATDRPSTPESMDAEIAKLRREIVAAAGEARSAIEERITALCAARDGIRQQAVAATSREMAALELDRANAEARLTQLKSAWAGARDRFQVQVNAIVRDTDEEIAILSVRADAAAGTAKQALASAGAALKTKRDVIQAKLSALPGMAAAQWNAATADIDVAMQELSSLRDRGLSGAN